MLYTFLAASSFHSSSEVGKVCSLICSSIHLDMLMGISWDFNILSGWCQREEVTFRNRDFLLLFPQDSIKWILYSSFAWSFECAFIKLYPFPCFVYAILFCFFICWLAFSSFCSFRQDFQRDILWSLNPLSYLCPYLQLSKRQLRINVFKRVFEGETFHGEL